MQERKFSFLVLSFGQHSFNEFAQTCGNFQNDDYHFDPSLYAYVASHFFMYILGELFRNRMKWKYIS